MFCLEEYLERIGYPDSHQKPPPTRETLITLQRCHHTAIPFDNFDFHLRDTPIMMDPHQVWQKIKNNRRGTYCFQGNYLFHHALQELGFTASLLCVSPYRPYAGSFAVLPGHCFVVIDVDGEWLVADVSTVDSIDGVVSLSEDFEKIQTTNGGVRYKFSLLPQSPYCFPSELEAEVRSIDSSIFHENVLCISLIKEETKTDANYDPVQPVEKFWIPRFSFKLPLQPGIPYPPENATQAPSTLSTIPPSLHLEIAKHLIEWSIYRDPRAHGYKQWLAINYSRDGKHKKIVAGFRYIELDRPYSARKIKRVAEGLANTGKPVGEGEECVPREVVDSAFQEINQHLQELGVCLSVEELEKLKVDHNFCLANAEHVWAR
jgi:hypothetical protein